MPCSFFEKLGSVRRHRAQRSKVTTARRKLKDRVVREVAPKKLFCSIFCEPSPGEVPSFEKSYSVLLGIVFLNSSFSLFQSVVPA